MKADGMTVELIAKYTGLTAEEIEGLKYNKGTDEKEIREADAGNSAVTKSRPK